MKNKFLWATILFLALILVSVLILSHEGGSTISKVCINERCFNVSIADTTAERGRGLMFVQSLPQDEGMLFTYSQEKILSFWMKNTLIPLDILWINEDMQIVHIERNAQPCSEECPMIKPRASAKYVLEINGNLSNQSGFSKGQKVKFIYA